MTWFSRCIHQVPPLPSTKPVHHTTALCPVSWIAAAVAARDLAPPTTSFSPKRFGDAKKSSHPKKWIKMEEKTKSWRKNADKKEKKTPDFSQNTWSFVIHMFLLPHLYAELHWLQTADNQLHWNLIDILREIKTRWKYDTLQEINISHLGKGKIIFKMPFLGDMLVPWRVTK